MTVEILTTIGAHPCRGCCVGLVVDGLLSLQKLRPTIRFDLKVIG
jgi:hypothetical protein